MEVIDSMVGSSLMKMNNKQLQRHSVNCSDSLIARSLHQQQQSIAIIVVVVELPNLLLRIARRS